MSKLLGRGLLGSLRPAEHPGYVSGLWYGPPVLASLSNGAVAADTLYAQPIFLHFPCAIQQLGMTVGAQAPGLAKMGIYRNGPDGRPGGLVAECSTAVDFNVAPITPLAAGFAAAPALEAGVHWLAAVFSLATATPYTWQWNQAQAGGYAVPIGSPTAAGTARGGSSPTSRLTRAHAYADPLPASFGAATVGLNAPGCPIIAFRVL